MPRYVDIDDVEVSDYVTVWDCNCSEFGRQTVMAVDDLQYLPTADVVPKSEVVTELFADLEKILCLCDTDGCLKVTALYSDYAELKKKHTEG